MFFEAFRANSVIFARFRCFVTATLSGCLSEVVSRCFILLLPAGILSNHAQDARSGLDEFLKTAKNFVDQWLPLHHSLGFWLVDPASIAGPHPGTGLLPFRGYDANCRRTRTNASLPSAFQVVPSEILLISTLRLCSFYEKMTIFSTSSGAWSLG